MMDTNTNIFEPNNKAIAQISKKQTLTTLALVISLPLTLLTSYPIFLSLILGVFFSGCLVYLNRQKDELFKKNEELFRSQTFRPYTPDSATLQSFNDFEEFSSSKNSKQESRAPFGILYDLTETEEKIIVSKEVKESINSGICKIKNKDFLYNTWNYKSIDKSENKNIFNFYGLPGTGKTLSAREVARTLKKKLYIVDYAQTESKMVGDTEKHISEIFSFAKKNDAIILLDEADTLVSKRVEDNTSSSRHINAARNVFMQELDKFDGIVILTTNLFSSFDSALLRRISQHIKFDLPNQEMRKDIIKAHIPEAVTLSENINIDEIAVLTKGFSGGDIKNFTREAMLSAILEADSKGCLTNAVLDRSHLISQIEKINLTKDVYNKTDPSKVIGIRN